MLNVLSRRDKIMVLDEIFEKIALDIVPTCT